MSSDAARVRRQTTFPLPLGRLGIFVAMAFSVDEAAQNTWEPIAPGGGCVMNHAVSQCDNDLLLTGSDVGGAFRSEDSGKTRRRFTGLPISRPQWIVVGAADKGAIIVTSFGQGTRASGVPPRAQPSMTTISPEKTADG